MLPLLIAWAWLAAAAPPQDTAREPLRVLTTRAIATLLAELTPQVERVSGRRLNIVTDIAARLVARVRKGEPFDVLVASPAQIDALVTEGKIVPGSRTNLTRSGIGVEVRAGSPKPDIRSVEAFKAALLAAPSIAYLKEGQSGIYLAGVIDRLGITKAIEHKVTRPETDVVSELVAKGEVALGLVVITQILTTPGVELVGPLPDPLQTYVTFTGGISTMSRHGDAARALIRILTGPEALPVIRAQGMERVP